MKILIDKGHSKKQGSPNYGAVGIVHESKEVRVIGDLVIKYLKQLGHEVADITVDNPSSNSSAINDRVNKANKHSDADMLISIHLNAFNGKAYGSEVLTYNGKHMIEAERILKNLEKLGYANRGIKNGTSPRRLGVINSTKMPSMIVECFFCDNKGDVERYNADSIARAIVEGATNESLTIGSVSDEVVKSKDKIDLLLLGENISINGFNKDNAIYIDINGSYISVREVLEKLGLKVGWKQELGLVTADIDSDSNPTKDATKISLLGKRIDVKTYIHKDQHCLKIDNAYVPIRDIFETMGLKVGYDNKSKLISISK